MKTLKSWRVLAIANIALAAGGALVLACSGDDSSELNIPVNDASTSKDTGVTPGQDTGTGSPDTSTPQGEPPGCFSGTPVNTLDFQNAFTTEAYVIFDNCARICYCDGGSLPALVAPPGPDAGAADAADSAAADTSTADAADASTDGG